jgi:hypothetical protein
VQLAWVDPEHGAEGEGAARALPLGVEQAPELGRAVGEGEVFVWAGARPETQIRGAVVGDHADATGGWELIRGGLEKHDVHGRAPRSANFATFNVRGTPSALRRTSF